MKILVYAAVVVAAVFSLHTATLAQSDLDRIDEKLTRHIEKVMPGWKHERVEPVSKSENVLIQFWSFSERKVKISVIPHRSANEAREALQDFMKYERDKEVLSATGDEAYGWGYGMADIAFRKGRLTMFVSTTAEIGARPEERMLSQDERFHLMKSEMRRWSREFAKHAANAIDSP